MLDGRYLSEAPIQMDGAKDKSFFKRNLISLTAFVSLLECTCPGFSICRDHEGTTKLRKGLPLHLLESDELLPECSK